MTAEKKLWLIEGIPGSGKSTATRKLGQNGEEFARMEAREAFNGRYAPEELMKLMEARWRGFAQRMTGRHIFECAFMQNPVGELMLFDDLPEEEIRKMQLRLAGCLAGCDVKLGYLRVPSVRAMPFPTVIADASDHERAQRELAAFFGEA